MTNPTISVVVPTYNSHTTIKRALDSVLRQTYPPNEVFIIDDCSHDKSAAFVKDYINQNELKNWFLIGLSKNSGAGWARHAGIMASKSDYISFLDSDDVWVEGHLDEALCCLRKFNADIFGAQVAKGLSNKLTTKSAAVRKISFKSLLFKSFFLTSTVVLRRNIYIQAGGFDRHNTYSEDYRLYLKIAAIARKDGMIVSDAIHAYYSISADRLSTNYLKMEKGELSNFLFLYKSNKINFIFFMLASIFSLLKFSKRFFLREVG